MSADARHQPPRSHGPYAAARNAAPAPAARRAAAEAEGFADRPPSADRGRRGGGGGQGRCRRAEAMRASARGIGALVLGSTSETVTCEAAECYAAAPVNGWNTAHTHAETGFWQRPPR